MDQNLLDLLPEELKNVASDCADLILERSLVSAYQNLSEEDKAKMAQIFNEGTDREKANFLNNYLSDLPKIIIEETQKIAQELKQKSV